MHHDCYSRILEHDDEVPQAIRPNSEQHDDLGVLKNYALKGWQAVLAFHVMSRQVLIV